MNITDMPNDLDFADAPAVEATVLYTEPCKKCPGRGTFYSVYGRPLGRCFSCNGAGKHEFKTSPQYRAKARIASAQRKQRTMETAYAEWSKANPAHAAWIERNPSFEFAQNMRAAVERFGSLTEGQMGGIDRCIEREAARAAEKAQRAAEAAARAEVAPTVDSTKLHEAFANALAKGLKYPKIVLGGMKIKPAKDTSKNPGALYVTEGEQYLGKVIGGRFLKVRECNADQEAKVVDLINDPKKAAEAYGQQTGMCCICNAELTNKASIERGIGPICAEKFGW